MQITIRLLASYRQYLPEDSDAQASYPFQIPAGACVNDVLAELPIPEEDYYTFFVNGRHARGDTILHDGDIVSVFPAVGGG
jgi:molybdopterin synthase sulfur carrier subunit